MIVKRIDLEELKREELKQETSKKMLTSTSVRENYEIDYENSIVTAFYSEKVMVDRYEPAEVSLTLQAPVSASSKEQMEKAAQELLRIVKDSARPFVFQLRERKQANLER